MTPSLRTLDCSTQRAPRGLKETPGERTRYLPDKRVIKIGGTRVPLSPLAMLP
jgi:hypothetical protein